MINSSHCCSQCKLMTHSQSSACLIIYYWQYFTSDNRAARGEHLYNKR